MHENVGTIASALLTLNGEEDTPDYLEVLESLKPLMWPKHFVQICESMEVCPFHLCDEQICKDDEDDCPAGRGESSAEDDVPGVLLPEGEDGWKEGSARRELEHMPAGSLQGELSAVAHGDTSDDGQHIEAHLDWSAQLRQREHLTWAEALRAGSIFYYG